MRWKENHSILKSKLKNGTLWKILIEFYQNILLMINWNEKRERIHNVAKFLLKSHLIQITSLDFTTYFLNFKVLFHQTLELFLEITRSLKFGFSEKARKIWRNLPQGFGHYLKVIDFESKFWSFQLNQETNENISFFLP